METEQGLSLEKQFIVALDCCNTTARSVTLPITPLAKRARTIERAKKERPDSFLTRALLDFFVKIIYNICSDIVGWVLGGLEESKEI